MSALSYESRTSKSFVANPTLAMHSTNIMDKWILASANTLITHVRSEMDKYHLYSVVRGLLKFIEDLTNWYIRFNRRRLKGEEGEESDCVVSLSVLFEVLLTLSR